MRQEPVAPFADNSLEARLRASLNMVPAHAWYALASGTLTFVNERIAGYLGLPDEINLDIEERKQAEFYLAEGQRLAHMGSWAFDATGFEYWSSELFEIHGLKPDDKAPTTSEYVALVHPEDREIVAQEIQKMLLGWWVPGWT
jgi:hypothetical protein